MKHLTPANAKAQAFVEAEAEGREEEVVAMNSLVGCTTSLIPAGKWMHSAALPISASRWKPIFMVAPIRAGGRRSCPTP